MQKNLFLIGIALFTILFVGVVLFKKHTVPSGPITSSPQSQSRSASHNTNHRSIPTEANIAVTSPKPNDTVQFPIIITGKARVFESQLNYRITDEKGNVLSKGDTTANSPDAGQFGPFTITVSSLGDFTSGKMTIEIFDYSAKDGSEIDKVTIPITIQAN